jgi:heme/copper-type cytochrome/quinol oxidase subunit 2
MRSNDQRRDRYLLLLLLAIIVGLPVGIHAYEQSYWHHRIPANAKVFTLTGHTDRGWILGDVSALDILGFGDKSLPPNKPVIRVHKGDRVVLKLKSSDVVHGFSLKDLGIFIDDGIPPGKVRLVSFIAKKAGRFIFSCNAICGANHEKMQGTLIVTA